MKNVILNLLARWAQPGFQDLITCLSASRDADPPAGGQHDNRFKT
jgi:hypothetical protein